MVVGDFASAGEYTREFHFVADLSLSYARSAFARLFQKKVHAIEIDDGMTDVQRVHSQNPADSRAALP